MIKLTRRTRYGCLLAVGGVAAVLYLNSLWGEFVFDDHEAIENNPDVRYDNLKLKLPRHECSYHDIHLASSPGPFPCIKSTPAHSPSHNINIWYIVPLSKQN